MDTELRDDRYISMTLQDKKAEIEYGSVWQVENISHLVKAKTMKDADMELTKYIGQTLTMVLRLKQKRKNDDSSQFYYSVEEIKGVEVDH